MQSRTMRAKSAWILAAGLIGGCESAPTHVTYADNPLLQARQPLLQPQGAPSTDTTQLAHSGPRMITIPPPGLYQQPPAGFAAAPAVPNQTPPIAPSPPSPPTPTPLAAAPPAPMPMSTPAPVATPVMAPPMPMPAPAAMPVMAPPMSSPPAPIVAPVAVVPAFAPAAPTATPPIVQTTVRTAEGKYGHSADYTWLQGELDRHYRGYLELRYRSASEEDRYGGKVRLEDDPRMAEFRPGDVIAVEGELLTDPDGANAAPWSPYKRFHIRAIRLVERK